MSLVSSAVPLAWATPALDPPRAFGPPLCTGVLRTQPDDFVVEEDLGFAPAGTGQHVLLKVRKRDANTQWIARELAKVCRCRPMDVGFAGLKDRRAVAVQWFTVPKSAQSLEAWTTIRTPEFEVLEAHAHTRKLPRGALAGNGFVIRVRDVTVTDQLLAERVELIARRGVPNYFGPQRFGRQASNLAQISGGLSSLRTQERGFVLSAARSLIFNAALAERVRDSSWDRLEAGDVANLDGRGSVFAVDAIDDTLIDRCQRLDIHPTGPMWGRGSPATQGRVLELESRVAAQFPAPTALVEAAGMEQERRSLRLAVHNLTWTRERDADTPVEATANVIPTAADTTEFTAAPTAADAAPTAADAATPTAAADATQSGTAQAAVAPSGTIVLRFRLTRGSFATTVIRELFDATTASDAPETEF